MGHTQESAELIALRALGWLAGNDDLLPTFLGSTGVSESDLRDRAGDPHFLGAVLDFLMMDDAWVMQFCDTENIAYDQIMPARAALPGPGGRSVLLRSRPAEAGRRARLGPSRRGMAISSMVSGGCIISGTEVRNSVLFTSR